MQTSNEKLNLLENNPNFEFIKEQNENLVFLCD